ncbi:MAG: 4a-hydroxytetrahydrobiopterin dehydratase [Candidatus Binatia bacterium]|nr:4a-hydroxytetrahydrobiopterin dehydratase [Candidatus Binatia bacterium]
MAGKRTKLSDAEIQEKLGRLPGWTVVNGKLHREYKFKDFVHAFGFMASAALVAESMNHHPEWFNVYSTVKVDLMTHDVGGISELDFVLADKMEMLARSNS